MAQQHFEEQQSHLPVGVTLLCRVHRAKAPALPYSLLTVICCRTAQ
jgi:hypothetical protein